MDKENKMDKSTSISKEVLDLLSRCGSIIHHNIKGNKGQGKSLSIIVHKKEISQKSLQEILKVQPASVSEIISKLETKGLITKEKDPSDKRIFLIKPTEKGITQAEKNSENHHNRTDRLFKSLNEEELSNLKDYLERVHVDWETLYEKKERPRKRRIHKEE